MIAAGPAAALGYPAFGTGGPTAGAGEVAASGLAWSGYGSFSGPSLLQDGGLDAAAAVQQALAASGEGLTYFDTSSSMPAQAAAASNTSIAKRKCGRPKAPNPLEDPTISEKRARRIMANRASADRSKQRKKMQEAAARQHAAANNAQLADVSRQISDMQDCISLVELVQAAVGRSTAPEGALHSLRAQLQAATGHSPDASGSAGHSAQQRAGKRKSPPQQQREWEPQEPQAVPPPQPYSSQLQVQQPEQLLLPQLQQQPAPPLSDAAALQTVLAQAIAPVVSSAADLGPAAAAAAVIAQQQQQQQQPHMSQAAPAAQLSYAAQLPVVTGLAPAGHLQAQPQQAPQAPQQQRALDALARLAELLDQQQQSQQQQPAAALEAQQEQAPEPTTLQQLLQRLQHGCLLSSDVSQPLL